MTRWGDFLTGHMKARGWNQAQLAGAVGVDGATVSNWINKTAKPKLEKVQPIATALGVPVVEVLVATELISEDELSVTRVVPDPDLLSDEELLHQLAKRMRQRRTEVIVPVAPPVKIAGRVVNRASRWSQ
ncbi:helix-turn-helix domain-containing protein [Rhodococcus opacus]|uniref:helix-turn-helix domain-containing protein n=1 Tax=Rhodococcus opacus TaxID=37919 RepID=UPI002235ACD4|nr:helix-turn-helix transcriptional regulator [Rhodococcus opacus]UZG58239.1 helix-turn-helix transcriptional regulator [Rhodococcus opacus]